MSQVQQNGYSAVLDLQSLGFTREAQTGAIATPAISNVVRKVSSEGYFINSFLSLDENDIFIKGEHSMLFLGDTIQVSKITAVFKGIDFEVRGAYPPLMVVTGLIC